MEVVSNMKPDKEQLVRYFKGACSREEEAHVQAFVGSGEDAALVEECIRIVWEAMHDKPLQPEISPEEQAQAWKRFMYLRSLPSEAKGTGTMQRSDGRKWFRYAAAAMLTGIVAISCWLFLRNTTSTDNITYQHVEAPTGERRLVRLPDGSTITLYPGSSLDIPGSYDQVDRRILVNGRAFFEVAPDAQKPFYVTAAQLVTRVLGTSFEVNTGYGSNQVAITLLDGAISISHGEKELARLQPQQQFTFDTTNADFEIKRISAAQVTAWTKGMLIYDQVRLDSICKDLERWYGISILIDNPQLVKKRITISLKQQPVNEMLRILSETSGFRYTMKQRNVNIY